MAASESPAGHARRGVPERRLWLLMATVVAIATSGIVYELVAGTVASYLLGDSVTQFSIVMGVYLSALGLGSHLSRFVPDARLGRAFVEVELGTALVGGVSAPALFVAFGRTHAFAVVLYGLVVAIGTLVGLELPLLVRILRRYVGLRDLIARALTFDYVGALIGSLLFALVVVPRLGLVRTSLAFGMVNAVVAFASTWLVGQLAPGRWRGLRARAVLVVGLLGIAMASAARLTRFGEEAQYGDDVVFADQTQYQRIVVTRSRSTWQLYLNGGLQFSSGDEYRYHEALVHPAFSAAADHARVLVVGGGDGLAAREILRYPDVSSVTLVDLDPEMTRIARTFRPLQELNGGSLDDPRLSLVNEDAMLWLGRHPGTFDVIVVDFPDPNSFAVGKLYTERFYASIRAHLAEGGVAVVQATSPLMSRTSFWCIVRTMRAANLFVRPYHAALPSFGEWGFALASARELPVPDRLRTSGLRFLDDGAMAALFVLPRDMSEVDAEINRLDDQVLVRYQDREWKKWD
jgi:spermidine synthase